MQKMAFDFKKEYKEFYLPKNKAQIVTMPTDELCSSYEVQGNPDEEGGQYQKLRLVFCILLLTLSR